MIIIIYGTTGELIKILPLIQSIPKNQQFRISTEQQPKQLKGLQVEAKAPEPHMKIARGRKGKDLEKITDMLFWLIGTVIRYRSVRRQLKKLKKENSKRTLVVVHGDTVTTVLGAIFGRLQGLPVAHIEAGLRSGNWRHPFPEELDRRIVSKIATMHFAPGDVPLRNLKKSRVKGETIDTRYNTVLDSLRLAKSQKRQITGYKTLPDKYFVVSIHRNELMARPDELQRILKSISDKSKEIPCIFLDHPVTKEKIRSLKFDNILETTNIIRFNKLQYFQFISLIANCEFIITDSGGLQEESAYLGIPCLVHRLTTEREEGLDRNVVLSRYDDRIVKEFFNNPSKYRTSGLASNYSPTQRIIEVLKKQKYIN